MTEISDELIFKHTDNLHDLEAKIDLLPESPEKLLVQEAVGTWHAELYADLIAAGGPVVAARDGTPKTPPPPGPK